MITEKKRETAIKSLGSSPLLMENSMRKNMDNDMASGVTRGFVGILEK